MEAITNLDALIKDLKGKPSRRVAVAAGHDPNTIVAAARAASEDIAQMTLVGDKNRIDALCDEHNIDPSVFTIIDEPNVMKAGAAAVAMVHDGQADVLMKGLIQQVCGVLHFTLGELLGGLGDERIWGGGGHGMWGATGSIWFAKRFTKWV